MIVAVLMAVLSCGEARFGRGGGSGRATGSGGRAVATSTPPNLGPADQLEQAAKQVEYTLYLYHFAPPLNNNHQTTAEWGLNAGTGSSRGMRFTAPKKEGSSCIYTVRFGIVFVKHF